jgi:hypothetical protein
VYLGLVAAQPRKPRENAVDNAIAAGAHKWECTFCVCPYTRKKPATRHRVTSMQVNLDVVLGEVECRGRL